jgi:hypothetical protein
MRVCVWRCGFTRVADSRRSARFAWPCDLGATQCRRGVRQTDARLLAVAAAADSMIVTTSTMPWSLPRRGSWVYRRRRDE